MLRIGPDWIVSPRIGVGRMDILLRLSRARRLGSFLLRAAFGLLALFFQSLHFFLAFQECSGHTASLDFEFVSTTAQALLRCCSTSEARAAGAALRDSPHSKTVRGLALRRLRFRRVADRCCVPSGAPR